MAEQAVDLRSTLSILRRRKRPLVAAAMTGAAAGLCSVLLWPPLYSSSSLVLLPPAEDGTGQAITRDVATTTRVAGSEAVLAPAGKTLTPPMTALALTKRVKVSAPTTDVVQIEARAETPQRAQAISRAVAQAEVNYMTDSSSSLTAAQQATLAARKRDLQASLGKVNEEIDKATARRQQESPTSAQAKADAAALAQLTAQQANLVLQLDQVKSVAAGVRPNAGATIIQGASPAERPGVFQRLVLFALLGLAVAVAITAFVLTMRARHDRRVRARDEMADAVGSPVIASVRSRVPSTVAGWQSLLEGYDPGTVDAWALRQALRQLVPHEVAARTAGGSGQPTTKARRPVSITIVTLSDDLRGLAMGPQLAAYAASTGVTTRLVTGQGHESAAALWAACSGIVDQEIRPGLFVSTVAENQRGVDLTIVLTVLDRGEPKLGDLLSTSATVLALSPGTATPEDLARAAVTIDDAGTQIAGIVVADPDDLDRTTGRLLQHERSQQAPLPTRLTGLSTSKPAPAAAGGGTKSSGSGRSTGGRSKASTSSSRSRRRSG
jgi:capsular polysaccharide biosynthesis protein